MFSVVLHGQDPTITDIHLDDDEFKTINPDYLSPFNIQEPLYKCNVFPDGVVDGAIKDNNIQKTVVAKLYNYLEYCQIMEDEIQVVNGQKYMTHRFFKRRHIGWKLDTFVLKPGNLVGYFCNGYTYHKSQKDRLVETMAKSVYKELVKETSAYKKLQEKVQNGESLNFISKNSLYVKLVKHALEKST